jgi:phosphoserine phosphatase
MNSYEKWIGVDLDGTLTEDTGWRGPSHFGRLIIPMFDRVIRWLALGRKIKIMTARANPSELDYSEKMLYLKAWIKETFGEDASLIDITCSKDLNMVELWDDRCVQVEKNTGRRIDGGE